MVGGLALPFVGMTRGDSFSLLMMLGSCPGVLFLVHLQCVCGCIQMALLPVGFDDAVVGGRSDMCLMPSAPWFSSLITVWDGVGLGSKSAVVSLVDFAIFVKISFFFPSFNKFILSISS